MFANSTPVHSTQADLHPDLCHHVRRALANEWQRPIAEHTRAAFEGARRFYQAHGGPLILDAGCGTGHSTRQLARYYPSACVLGIDRSADRLSRDYSRELGAFPANAMLVRADLVDFWRLAHLAGWRPIRHCIFYPNPYPKGSQLKKRWHAHPVFPVVLALGGVLELRSNWQIYVEEFACAVGLVTGQKPGVERLLLTPESDFISAFEHKYFDSGHTLWQLQCSMTALPPPALRCPDSI
ncbi:tRNA (guanine(46)-N(7))-methyltransferase TrmB [Kushneria phyllosphaerae]|uniref:tRNA (guanine(46)-N(7))-methyltransferase n=1 Tax=Kushneria phyllosphaerae TaxID=2100822 RepID=A0A2R8CJQ9_9GAMM|nr:class I SAM-dependent methyltransferase [Kushneria phyllosphaerae]SPJ33147.1 tRNA (guanine-N(7)-)-methyltransferase [Kushneria phyllosphaerae]